MPEQEHQFLTFCWTVNGYSSATSVNTMLSLCITVWNCTFFHSEAAQRHCECCIPGGSQGHDGWALSNLICAWQPCPWGANGTRWSLRSLPSQAKPVYDSASSHISSYVCKNILGLFIFLLMDTQGFCWVQPGFSSLFLNEWSYNDTLVPEKGSFKFHVSTVGRALTEQNLSCREEEDQGCENGLSTPRASKAQCSYRVRVSPPPRQSMEGWQRQKQPTLRCMKTPHYENLPKTIQREKSSVSKFKPKGKVN